MINDPGSTIEDVSLCIYDVTGRLVKSFHPESSIMNHESRLLWDGTDEVGRAVAHGIYFIYLQTGESQTVAKTILLQ